ncbi:MAG: hypothetical protein P3A28_04015 [Gemmatimonadota bacterium]|nr:hypothetical protein [Gemmatimonadota bacterium]
MRKTILALIVSASAGSVSLAAQESPGVAILERMRKAYDGKWYNTLTFVQRTITAQPGAKPDTSIWYETVIGSRLRIDIGDPALGNGMLYTPDSAYVMRGGALARAIPAGNPFLPLIMGVYLQPAERTARELAAFGFDFSKTTTGTWQDAPVTIVGAAAPTDTTSAQFWVDSRNLVVRVIGNVRGTGGMAVEIDGYERAGDGWLGTRVIMSSGTRSQVEEYTDWKVGIPIDPALHDLTQWKTAPHWAGRRP